MMLTWSQRAGLTIEVWRTVARGQEEELESEGRTNHRGLEDCSERTGHGKVAERGSQPFGWRKRELGRNWQMLPVLWVFRSLPQYLTLDFLNFLIKLMLQLKNSIRLTIKEPHKGEQRHLITHVERLMPSWLSDIAALLGSPNTWHHIHRVVKRLKLSFLTTCRNTRSWINYLVTSRKVWNYLALKKWDTDTGHTMDEP